MRAGHEAADDRLPLVVLLSGRHSAADARALAATEGYATLVL